MRFWQKIFVISLAVLMVTVNVLAVVLIANNHTLNTNKEIESGLDEYSIIASSFQTNVLYERYRQSPDELGDLQIAQVAREFSYLFTLDNLYIQLNRENSKIYSNFGRELPQELIEGMEKDDRARVLVQREDDGRVYLYISSPVVLQSETYLFTTVKDITDIDDVREQQLGFFRVLGPLFSMVVALILLCVSMLLTKRIDRLRKSTMLVAQGDYKTIDLHSADEIGELAEDFNKMTAAVKQKVEQLESVAEERKQFIDNMTHELKTPLTSIIGFSDLLRTARLDDDTIHDYAAHIYNEGQYLKTISSKLMQLILLRNKPEMTVVNIKEFVQEIHAAIAPIAKNRKLNFKSSCVPCKIEADPELLKSMVYNLIDNAVKASTEGTTIQFRAYLGNGRKLRLSVEDQGSGIPEKEKEKIFQPFYRVDKSRARKEGGAGLGLALCQEIAAVHDASLEISSTLGKGTTVTVCFHKEVLP